MSYKSNSRKRLINKSYSHSSDINPPAKKRKVSKSQLHSVSALLIKAGECRNENELNEIRSQLNELTDNKNKNKSKNSNTNNKLDKNKIESISESDEEIITCRACNKETIDKNIQFCDECCENCGCKEECCYDYGMYCSQCKQYICGDCGGIEICDDCLEMYCHECTHFKPGKGGGTQCSSCQPWWKKNKPANAFCSGCGSSRNNAHFCTGCGKRYCGECPGFNCCECSEFYCEGCNEMEFCEECGECFCDGCGFHEC
eukprot:142860_1